MFQPTRPVRGVTRWSVSANLQYSVSTHTPRAGRDLMRWSFVEYCSFQPTRPVRGVTEANAQRREIANVSTHTPRAGRDGDRRSCPR